MAPTTITHAVQSTTAVLANRNDAAGGAHLASKATVIGAIMASMLSFMIILLIVACCLQRSEILAPCLTSHRSWSSLYMCNLKTDSKTCTASTEVREKGNRTFFLSPSSRPTQSQSQPHTSDRSYAEYESCEQTTEVSEISTETSINSASSESSR